MKYALFLLFLLPLFVWAGACESTYEQCQLSCCTSSGDTYTGSMADDTYRCNSEGSLQPVDECISTTCTPDYLDCYNTPPSCKSQQQNCIQGCYGSSDENCFETCDNNAIDCMDAGTTTTTTEPLSPTAYTPPTTTYTPPSANSGCCGGLALLLGVPFLFVAGKRIAKR